MEENGLTLGRSEEKGSVPQLDSEVSPTRSGCLSYSFNELTTETIDCLHYVLLFALYTLIFASSQCIHTNSARWNLVEPERALSGIIEDGARCARGRLRLMTLPGGVQQRLDRRPLTDDQSA